MLVKRIEMLLPCTLSEEELASRSLMLAETVQTKVTTKAAQTQSAKEYRDLLTGLDERQLSLSRVLRTGIEERMVRCIVQFHVPAEATKRIIREDTGEVVREEAMSPAECQMHIFGSQQEFEEFMRSQVETSAEEREPEEKDDSSEPGDDDRKLGEEG